jgi:hypothetical protein
MNIQKQIASLLALVGILLAGCQKEPDVLTAPGTNGEISKKSTNSAPSPIVSVDAGGTTIQLWPYTAPDFSGSPEDPINLIFAGKADPRAIRAALMLLDGDRTAFGFPNEFPFNATWSDAIGGVQAGYGQPNGWVGGAIQMQCAEYGPLRFHLRLFDIGSATIANAHFEVLIPGTTEHQVLSYELAEQLVVVDLIRSGLLDSDVPYLLTGQINPSPFGEIPPIIYNGLPTELRAAIGGPAGDVSDPVPIASDGKATILRLAESVKSSGEVGKQDFTINFEQVIPKPFCSSDDFAYLFVEGPVHLRQTVVMTASGNFISQFHAEGHLNLTPVDPTTDPPTPIAPPYRAVVNEHHKGIVTDNATMASSFQMQIEIPASGPFRGRLMVKLNVGPGKSSQASLDVKCLP